MQFVDYNFVPAETANKILESYGYVNEAKEAEADEAPEAVQEEPSETIYVYEHDTGSYHLNDDIHQVEDDFYIQMTPATADTIKESDTRETQVVDSVEVDGSDYSLGDVFEDEESGETYVQLVTSD